MDLIERARRYASAAHRKVGQLRKYSGQPYEEHLRRVADIVAGVTDDAEMIAAAWLHDVVEDTPTTIEEVGREFGPGVRELVDAVTDVSRPHHGNRAARKALDREHLARAPARAQTVKLADLIDNCQDICKHNPQVRPRVPRRDGGAARRPDRGRRDAAEAGAEDDDTGALAPGVGCPADASTAAGDAAAGRLGGRCGVQASTGARVRRAAARSFDATTRCARRRGRCPLLGVGGRVVGYVAPASWSARFADVMHAAPTQVPDAGLADVVLALTATTTASYRSAARSGHTSGATRCRGRSRGCGCSACSRRRAGDDREHPLARRRRRLDRPPHAGAPREGAGAAGGARGAGPQRAAARLPAALRQDPHRARARRPAALPFLRGGSKAEAQRFARDLEELRNSLAHAQDIVTHDWAQIARIARRLEELATD